MTLKGKKLIVIGMGSSGHKELISRLEGEQRSKEQELLQDCLTQLEYLSKKFGETGTGNNLISKLKAKLNEQ